MTTYKGPAVLLVEDGRKFDAEADLTLLAPNDWRGTLAFHDSTLAQELLKITDGHVLIGSQSAEVSRQGTPDWSPASDSPLVMQVWGACPAPF